MKIFLNLKGIKVTCQEFFDGKKGLIISDSLRKFVCLRKRLDCLSKMKDQSFPDKMCMPENQVPLNNKKEIADALKWYFAKIGEKTSESAASLRSSSQK